MRRPDLITLPPVVVRCRRRPGVRERQAARDTSWVIALRSGEVVRVNGPV